MQLKPQPKSAAVTKANTSAGASRGGKNARGRGGKTPRGRPAKKTSDELDSEMADYFEKGTSAGEASAPAQPAGDAVMDDEILVSCKISFGHRPTNSILSKLGVLNSENIFSKAHSLRYTFFLSAKLSYELLCECIAASSSQLRIAFLQGFRDRWMDGRPRITHLRGTGSRVLTNMH